MIVDFTRLNNEYTVYWKSHNIDKALTNLHDIDYYLSQGQLDTFVETYDLLLKPGYLAGLFSQLTGKPLGDVVSFTSYNDLLENFRGYLTGLINESKAIDEKSKRDLQNLNNDIFTQMAGVASNFLGSTELIAKYLPYIAVGAGLIFVAVIITKRNK